MCNVFTTVPITVGASFLPLFLLHIYIVSIGVYWSRLRYPSRRCSMSYDLISDHYIVCGPLPFYTFPFLSLSVLVLIIGNHTYTLEVEQYGSMGECKERISANRS